MTFVTTTTTTDREVTVSLSLSPANAHALAYAKAHGWSASRTLSGMGHPGYGAAFSRRALARIESGQDIWQAIAQELGR